MARTDDVDPDEEPAQPASRDQDPVRALRDVEAEAGDEEGLADIYDEDDRAAREVGVDLDDRDEPEPELD
jgi:hypothetical protein